MMLASLLIMSVASIVVLAATFKGPEGKDFHGATPYATEGGNADTVSRGKTTCSDSPARTGTTARSCQMLGKHARLAAASLAAHVVCLVSGPALAHQNAYEADADRDGYLEVYRPATSTVTGKPIG